MTVRIHTDSTEYLRIPFTTEVDAGTVVNPQVAIVAGKNTPLPDSPDWINADVVTDETPPHLRILIGSDVELDPGIYTWYVRLTDNPEQPLERGENLIQVYR